MSGEISIPNVPKPEVRPADRTWHERWWRLMQMRVGYIPIPVALILAALLVVLTWTGSLSPDLTTMIAVLGLAGCILAEIGHRIPWLNQVGGPVIFATFVPAYLVAHRWMPEVLSKPIADFWKTSNFLYLYIATIIVGSILSMNRTVLIGGFLKIFIPLATGTVAAGAIGTLVGWLLGLGAWNAFFLVVVPIMAGGLGEGAIPLTLGYSEILHMPQGQLLAQVLPPIMLGNLLAIIIGGFLNLLGQRRHAWTGHGRLQRGHISDQEASAAQALNAGTGAEHVAAALIVAMTLYLLGVLSHKLFGLPGPVTMLFLTVLVKLVRGVPPNVEAGALSIYKFSAVGMTYPLLFAIGTVITPWNELVNAFSLASLVTVIATVSTIALTGFAVGRLLDMYPIDTAVVTVTHSGMGGTGDVAILTAANRMQLMPFAQIATRIGGAITVTLVLIVLAKVS